MKAVQASGHLARSPTLLQFQVRLDGRLMQPIFMQRWWGSKLATADALLRFPRTTRPVQLDANIKTNVDLTIFTPA